MIYLRSATKTAVIITLCVVTLAMCGISYAEEKYQVVDPKELSFTVQTEDVFFTDGGRQILGTIRTLYCEGKEIKLLSKQIQDGFISTEKYGKIMISPPPSLGVSYLPISVTHSQKKELLKLKKSQ